jgi:hypothetical protein
LLPTARKSRRSDLSSCKYRKKRKPPIMLASLGCFFAHLSYSLRTARLASSFFMLVSSCSPGRPFPMPSSNKNYRRASAFWGRRWRRHRRTRWSVPAHTALQLISQETPRGSREDAVRVVIARRPTYFPWVFYEVPEVFRWSPQPPMSGTGTGTGRCVPTPNHRSLAFG